MTDYCVSISVVTYNNESQIGKLLDSLALFVHGINYHIYIIDNCSSDRTVELIRNRPNQTITLIQSPKNRGFGGGHNMILNQLDSKYHICINPDILLCEDAVSAIAHYMDEHGDIGLLTPKILNADGAIQVLPKRNPKLSYLIARRIDLAFLKKYRNEYEMQSKDHDSKLDIEFCSGCFMFMRTALFKELDGFDERFFMYFEDADLTRRMRWLARAEYNPDFAVIHVWERAGKKSLKFFLIQVISMVKYMWKWRKTDRSGPD